jgi:hypothetical protein
MESLLRISDAVEVGPSPTGGHGLYARVDLSAGWLFHDHPVCVAEPGSGHRRLPIDIDELMCAVFTGERRGDPRLADLVSGPFKMTHLARHYEMQDEDVELPEWAKRLALPAAAYNMLAAQLQTNIARDATGDGLILYPRIRLANHSCAGNTEICLFEGANSALGGVPGCPCSVGNYVLRAKRLIRAGEELAYSYIGEHVLASSDELNERRALLERRWGFWCACPKCEEQEPKAQKPAEAETLVEAQKSEGELRGDQRGTASRAHEACGRSLRRRLAGSDAA